MSEPARGTVAEVAGLAFRLGCTAFGGPAAHIAMLEQETVTRRRWVSHQEFLDLLGATNLIPGPNSTQMVIHLSFARAGWPGLVAGGLGFIVPAAAISAALAWGYVRFAALPVAARLLFGIKPAVLAIIVAAVLRLGRAAAKEARLVLLGAAALAAALAGVNVLVTLLAGGAAGMVWLRLAPRREAGEGAAPGGGAAGALLVAAAPPAAVAAGAAAVAGVAAVPVSLAALGLFFLKVGSVLYGGGYVLVAFLQDGLVGGHGWLTQQQLLDAIAVGQLTPGPLLSTATFVGFLLAGVPGALVATGAVFFPSFVLVGAVNPLVPRLRGSAWMAAFLDSVNAVAVALMAAVVVTLARSALTDWRGWSIAALAAVASARFRVAPPWLVAGGALIGWLLLPAL
jgi:chromate transporter